ncbi:ABC transporter permease [Paenibacillus agricola]|uniref:ABC transporter permease n=1 Tax=Paenibacillus agricola TaxID=2716264 RepID=A0ABX0J8J0_9BACL|nr:ABC transporter permease [Paenibacillus agricola]NHN31705.1 ABC transporter permease [Paenibacillus agricola]
MRSLANEWFEIVKGKTIWTIFLVPLIVAVLFGYLFSNNQINETHLAIIDEDNSAYSRQLINNLDASQYIQVDQVFHSAMDPNMLFYNEKYAAVLYMPLGLEQNRYTGKQTNIGLVLDNTIPTVTTFVRQGVQEVFTTENTQNGIGKLKAMGLSDEAAVATQSGLALQQRSLYNPNSEFIMISVIGFMTTLIVSFMLKNGSAIIPRLRSEGLWEEELSRPLGILARPLPYIMFTTASILLAMGLLKQVGGMRFAGSPMDFLIPTFLFTSVTYYLAMAVTWTVSNPDKAFGRTLFILIPSSLLSGLLIPVPMLPAILQTLSKFVPINYYLKFVRGIGFRGGSLSYFPQEMGMLLLMQAFLFVIIGLLIWRDKRRLAQQTAKVESPTPALSKGISTV